MGICVYVTPTDTEDPATITLTGDVNGPANANVVNKIDGASVPAAGALTTGNALQVTGASALSYAPINLAGGANFVTGILPAGNQASQTMAGDVTGTTAASVVVAISHAAASIPVTPPAISWLSGVTAPTLTQAGNGPSGGAAQAITLAPQLANASGNSSAGSVIFNLGIPSNTGAEAYVTTERSGTVLWQNGALVGTVATSAIYGGNITPSASNYAFTCDGTTLQVSSPGAASTLHLQVNGADELTISPTVATITPATLAWVLGAAAPTIKQNANTADVVCQNLNITPQAPFASATGANRTSGSVIVNLFAPTNAGTGEGSFQISRQTTGFVGSIGPYPTAPSTYTGVWLGPGLTPSGTNFAFLSNGSSVSYLNCVNTNGSVILAFAGGAANAGCMVLTGSTGAFAWAAPSTAPALTQTANASTSAGSGAAGVAMSVSAQAGQAATGAAHNGGKGGTLTLAGGVGGTSGSATAGVGGVVAIGSGVTRQQITVAANYTVDTNSTTSDYCILCNQAGAITLTLPAPTAGRTLVIKDKSGTALANNITVSHNAAEKIDGANTYVINLNYASIELTSDGTNWFVTGSYNGTVV